MKNKTDLDSVKGLSKALLMTDLIKTKFSPMVVQHPFTNSGIAAINSNGTMKLLHIAENDDDLALWQQELGKAIDHADSAYSIFMMLNTPYTLTFLKFAEPYLGKADFSKMLGQAWVMSEYTSNNVDVSHSKLVSMFQKADPVELMSVEELEELSELGDMLTIYRGVTIDTKEAIYGMSWTLDYEIAEWFATRFHKEGKVYEAQICRGDVLALFNSRDESEIVVDPKDLIAVRQIHDFEETQDMKIGGL